MNIIITGAGGFLGDHLINFLSHKIQEKVSIYSLGTKELPKCKYYYINDVTDLKQINYAISSIKPDYLFHLAGASNNSLDFDSLKSVNTTYAYNLLKSLEINDLQDHTKIIMVGTSAEYGKIKYEDLPISENQTPNPETIYGKTKYDQTKNALSWQQDSRKLVVVRPFNIIGSKMPRHLAIGNFFYQICSITEKGFLKTGNLHTERDFVDVYDVVNLMWKLINNERAFGEVINICTGKPLPLKVLVNRMINLSGKEIKQVTDEHRIRKDDITIHYGDNKKLLSIIGDYTFMPWRETINKIMEN